MFGWFNKKKTSPQITPTPIPPSAPRAPLPPPSPAAPTPSPPQSQTFRGKLFLRGPHGDSQHEFDLIQSTAAALRRHGHAFTCREGSILHDPSGLLIEPRWLGMDLPNHGVHTVTAIDVRHPLIKAPRVFEYQHGAAPSLAESLDKGFDLWVQGDLPVLLDALEPSPKVCTSMELESPGDGPHPKKRRAILGPVAHLQPQPSATPEEHPFCACCFFTKTSAVFRELMMGQGFCAIRFFGMRDENGAVAADCRVNGDECEPGKAAIRDYVATWPGTGLEFRKQYVVWQDLPEDAAP